MVYAIKIFYGRTISQDTYILTIHTLPDTVDQRSHDTSGRETYLRSQSCSEDPLSIFQGHVAGALGGKQSEVGIQVQERRARAVVRLDY